MVFVDEWLDNCQKERKIKRDESCGYAGFLCKQCRDLKRLWRPGEPFLAVECGKYLGSKYLVQKQLRGKRMEEDIKRNWGMESKNVCKVISSYICGNEITVIKEFSEDNLDYLSPSELLSLISQLSDFFSQFKDRIPYGKIGYVREENSVILKLTYFNLFKSNYLVTYKYLLDIIYSSPKVRNLFLTDPGLKWIWVNIWFPSDLSKIGNKRPDLNKLNLFRNINERITNITH